MAQHDQIDLEELVRKYVANFPLDKSTHKEMDEILPTDINWDHMKTRHGKTEYFNPHFASSPKTHVLFTAHFTNDTDQAQVYTLKTERRTKSTCNLALDKSFSLGVSLDLKLTPPNPIIEANVGFKGEYSMSKSTEESFEEEIVWAVDNQITVPASFKTKASLVIKEEEYDSQFKTDTLFEGDVYATLRSKKDGSVLTSLSIPVEKILTEQKGFRVDKTGIHYLTQGRCRCRFGVEQHVRLSQSKLTAEDIEGDTQL